MNLSCDFCMFDSYSTKGKSTGNMSMSAARSLVLYYMNGSDNKGKQNNISRVKVSVSRPLWRAPADGSLCRGRRLVTRVDSFRWALCSSSVSMETAKCSGRPLTHAVINYCLLLSSVLNKGRHADKNITRLYYKMNLQLMLGLSNTVPQWDADGPWLDVLSRIMCIVLYWSCWCIKEAVWCVGFR